MRERAGFWGRVLLLGADRLNMAAGWAGAIILLLGVVAGISVSVVLHLSHWLIAVIVLGLLVFITTEGGYRVWRESDQARKAEEGAAQRTGSRDARNRSVVAAKQLAVLVAKLDGCVTVWEKGSQDPVSSELAAAYNDFSEAEVGAAGELTDKELYRRVHLHSMLTNVLLAAVGAAPQYRPQLAKVLHEHAKSVSRSLQAHQQGKDLPAYNAPPLEVPINIKALLAWRSSL